MSRISLLWMVVLLFSLEHHIYGQAGRGPSPTTGTSFRRVPRNIPTQPSSASGSSSTVLGNVASASSTVSCDEVKHYVPYRHLQELMTPHFGNFKVSLKGNKIEMIIPSYDSTCQQLDFQYRMVDNNLFIETKRTDENGNDITHGQYVACLERNGVLGPDPQNPPDGKLYDSQHQNVTYKTQPPIITDINQFDFDRSEDVHIYFASPNVPIVGGDYSPVHAQVTTVSHGGCLQQVENLYGEEAFRLHTSPETAARESAEACSNCSVEEHAQRTMQALADLDESSVANAQELKQVLNRSLLETRKQEAQNIHNELEGLSGQFFLNERNEINVTERRAAQLAREYYGKLRELDRVLVTPLKEQVETLLEEYNKATDDYNRDRIEEEITVLTNLINEYSERDYDRLKRGLAFYGLTERARNIEELRLRASAYSRMYVGRRGALSPGGAQRYIRDGLEDFDKTLKEWDLAYRARTGDRTVLREYDKRLEGASNRIRRDWNRFEQNERKGWQRNCGNNVFSFRCQRFTRGAERRRARAMQRREGNLSRLRQLGDNYERYSGMIDAHNNNNNDDEWYDNNYFGGSGFDSFGFGNPGPMMMGGPQPMMGMNPYAGQLIGSPAAFSPNGSPFGFSSFGGASMMPPQPPPVGFSSFGGASMMPQHPPLGGVPHMPPHHMPPHHMPPHHMPPHHMPPHHQPVGLGHNPYGGYPPPGGVPPGMHMQPLGAPGGGGVSW